MTKRLSLELKQARKHIQRACVFCNEKHLQCDVGRPCENCKKRNIGYLCRDKIRKSKKQISNREEEIQTVSEKCVESVYEKASSTNPLAANLTEASGGNGIFKQVKCSEETPVKEQNLDTLLKCTSPSFFGPVLPDVGSPRTLSSCLDTEQMKHISEAPQLEFDSTWTSNEYMKLNDLAHMYPKEGCDNRDTVEESKETEITPIRKSFSSQLFQFLNLGPTIPKSDSRPFISLDMAKENNILDSKKSSDTIQGAANHNEISPYRLRQLIKTPDDLFEKRALIKPHNYRAAYKQLLKCLHNMFLAGYRQDLGESSENSESSNEQDLKSIHAARLKLRRKQLRHIATSIVDRYMPTFVTLTSNMIEDDLLMQEMILQRTLLEYESMAKLVNCTPTCIWRRSGEICFVSNEFLSLTGFSRKAILNNKKFIVEFLDHQSVLAYYDLFHQILAFGSREKRKNTTSDGDAVFTQCKLLVNNGFFLKCSCCWSVKRDSFNIPLLIMGQFLPIFDGN